jgi:cob(I)alamin adenosyltransferase
MKLYTKTGDRGQTGLIGGARVEKDDARVSCYGDVDELNATIGLAIAALPDDTWRQALHAIQGDLFVLGAQLATAEGAMPQYAVTTAHVARLEHMLDETCAALPELTNFVLPGGCELAARFHLARTVCRRVERGVVSLSRNATVDQSAVVFLNRLSDLLFALALAANHRAGVNDMLWSGDQDRT